MEKLIIKIYDFIYGKKGIKTIIFVSYLKIIYILIIMTIILLSL